MDKKTEALEMAQELRALADRFSEGWHEGIKIDALDIELLAMAASAIEQPAPVAEPHKQQEPVAVVKALPMGHNQTDMHYAECQHLPVGTLLYTYPPASKPWVGLTYGEVLEQKKDDPIQFYRAINAKLREKNT